MKTFGLSDFDFELPDRLLAEYPAEKRDHSRLMVVHLADQTVEHRMFYDLPDYFSEGDLMVFNDTRVIPARMTARKESMKGALLQILLVEEIDGEIPSWVMLVDPLRKIKVGTNLVFGESELVGEILEVCSEKEVLVGFRNGITKIELRSKLFDLGKTPLPPYIRRPVEWDDSERYQTVFAKNDGALAAPTAGLHFTPELLEALSRKGVDQSHLTLTIGMGTFNPIYKENLDEFEIHKESFQIPNETADAVNRLSGDAHSRILAVGTTTLRALETAADRKGHVQAGRSSSQIFIRPGYEFKTGVSLLTNFHTPRSSLLMLISAFMGYEFTREVYQIAIDEEYRFFSYGDAMLILR